MKAKDYGSLQGVELKTDLRAQLAGVSEEQLGSQWLEQSASLRKDEVREEPRGKNMERTLTYF